MAVPTSQRAGRVLEAARPRLGIIRGDGPQRSALVPAAVVLVIAVFAVAAVQAYVGEQGLRVAELERRVDQAEERYALLRAQVADRSSPERVEQAAAELGMEPAPDPIYLPAPEPMPTPDSSRRDGYASKDLLLGVP